METFMVKFILTQVNCQLMVEYDHLQITEVTSPNFFVVY